MVASSNFHSNRATGVLAAVDCQLLARRIHLAWSTAGVPAERRVLLDFFHARNLLHGNWSDLVVRRIDPVSAAESLARFVELYRFALIACGSIDRV